ncbi:TonB-dependent receptor [Sphingobium sp. H39-3-25]|uniref:TonB-dependent receptor n=1 Tax=Sphingobium arseniciresistens TaxID=3030834 RepID=UPI0023B92981|nr:TonB-dependent receptor [Sphingobium arseniciresistens]
MASPVAAAQDAQDSASIEAAPDEITVTAQKRTEVTENVPISISTIGSDHIGVAGVSNLQELPQMVPGIRVDQLGSNTQPTIRGISSNVGGPGTSANVALYVDGFYQPSQLGDALDFNNIANIQVVKGPQGTLFGRNATGGAIMINTLDPAFKTAVRIDASYASFADARASIYATTGLTDTLAVDLAAYFRDADGFVTNVYNGRHDAYAKHRSIRGKLLFEPTSNLKFLLTVSHSDVKEPGPQVYSLLPDLAGTAQAPVIAPGSVTTSARKQDAQNTEAIAHTKTTSVYLKSTLDVGGVSLTSYTGYRDENSRQQSDLDGSSATLFVSDWTQYDRTFTQEFNLASAGNGALQWSAGTFYLHSNAGIPQFDLHFCDDCTLVLISSRIKTEAVAGFGDATYHLGGGLYATGGLRYSWEKQTYDYAQFGATGGGSQAWHGFSPRAALRYEFSPRTNVYASFNKGFKAGVFSTVSASLNAVEPEQVKAYEVGFKSAVGSWHFATSAYYYDYTNLQVSSYDLTTGAQLLQNAGSARIKGLEAEVSGRLMPGLSVRANAAYTHGRYRTFEGAVDTVLLPGGIGYESVPASASGKTMLRAPAFTANLGADYVMPINFGSLKFSGNLYMTSKIYYDALNRYSQKAYQVLNLSAEWNAPDNSFGVGVFGKNVTDTHYVNYVDPLSYGILANWGTPASYGVRLRMAF